MALLAHMLIVVQDSDPVYLASVSQLEERVILRRDTESIISRVPRRW